MRTTYSVGFIVSCLTYYILCRFVSQVPFLETSGWHEDKGWEPEDMLMPEDGTEQPELVYARSSKDVDGDLGEYKK